MKERNQCARFALVGHAFTVTIADVRIDFCGRVRKTMRIVIDPDSFISPPMDDLGQYNEAVSSYAKYDV